jgi:hypothetical protein
MKRAEKTRSSPPTRSKQRRAKDDSVVSEREELLRRQAELNQSAPADTPDGLIVSGPKVGPTQDISRK